MTIPTAGPSRWQRRALFLSADLVTLAGSAYYPPIDPSLAPVCKHDDAKLGRVAKLNAEQTQLEITCGACGSLLSRHLAAPPEEPRKEERARPIETFAPGVVRSAAIAAAFKSFARGELGFRGENEDAVMVDEHARFGTKEPREPEPLTEESWPMGGGDGGAL